MVAKSYQKYNIIDLPYTKNGKQYILIDVNGKQKEVRWYSEKEYAKMYPEDKAQNSTEDKYYKPQKIALGFDKGYITIFKNVSKENESWFEENTACRYARHWGWYVPSTIAVPQDYPKGVQAVRLDWEPMGNEKDWLKEESVVKAHVTATLLAAAGKKTDIPITAYNIGDRLDLMVKIDGKIEEKNGKYHSTTYIYDMSDGTYYYKWKTQAKDWVVGTEHKIRGTVKDIEDGIIILTRCIEK